MPLQALPLPVVALGDRGAAAPRPRLPARAARRAVRHRRGRVGRGGARPRRRSSSATTRPCSVPRRGAAAGRRAARRAPRGARPLRPSSGPTCSPATGLEAEAALPALWELVWAGEVTNDAWTPLRADAALRRAAGRAAAAPILAHARRRRPTSTQGRWSLAARLFAGAADRRALAELLLERQGIVTRDGVRGEGIAGGYGAVYGELRALETVGSAGAATSSKASAARSSRCPGRSSGCASCASADDAGRARARGSRPGPAVRRGSALAEARRCARRARGRARTSSCSAARRRSSSSAAAARSSRCAIPTRRGCDRRSARSSRMGPRRPCQAARGRALRRPAGDRERGDAASARSRLPRRPPSGRAEGLILRYRR